MKQTCCICNITFEGYGNNPYPIKENGTCCFWCNLQYVIPARFKKLKEHDNNQNKKRGLKKMNDYNNKSYTILAYEIRFRRSPDDEWNKEYFSTEEDAFEFFKTVYINHWECKMLKIEALESWW